MRFYLTNTWRSVLNVKHFHLRCQSTAASSRLINADKIFLKDCYSTFRFDELVSMSRQLKNSMLHTSGSTNLNGQKVGILCSNNYTYFISLLAVWLANGVPVPLNKSFTNNYLEYFLNDSDARLVVNGVSAAFDAEDKTKATMSMLNTLNIPVITLKEAEYFKANQVPQLDGKEQLDLLFNDIKLNSTNHDEALIIYTSGSSGPSKGKF